MKRFAATFFFLTIPLIMLSQVMTSSCFQTSGGLLVRMTIIEDGNFFLTIRYIDYGYIDDYSTITIEIPKSQINTFETQLKELEKKYNEWADVAIVNNVKDVKKVMPVSVSTFSKLSTSRLSYPQEKTVTPYFYVVRGNMYCMISIWVSGYGVKQCCEWMLSSEDFQKTITEIDKTIAKHKTSMNEKKQTEDLFH